LKKTSLENIVGDNMCCAFCNCPESIFVLKSFCFDNQQSFSLVRCCKCELIRTDPILSGPELATYYSPAYYGSSTAKFSSRAEKTINILNELRARWFYKKIVSDKGCKILDIGTGRGGFLSSMSRLGTDCYGVERAEFKPEQELPYQLYFGDLSELPLAAESFDGITMWHVFEHLENPRDTLNTIARLLRPNGVLLVAVPNISSWQATLFRGVWFHLDLPRHVHHYSVEWLKQKLQIVGEVDSVVTLPTIEQSLFGFIQSLQNVFLRESPNKLYKLLQRRRGIVDLLALLTLGAFALVLLPIALIEHLLSSLCGKNASVVLIVKKQ